MSEGKNRDRKKGKKMMRGGRGTCKLVSRNDEGKRMRKV